ncbi:MAG: MBL fold metallo-hydrolase [Verrucomicrobiota bacterium]
MKLLINGSSSRGNQYLLISQTGTLAIEAGVSLAEVKKSVNFDLSSIVACLVSHEHGDHAKCAKEYAAAGIDVFSTQGTLEAIGLYGHRAHVLPKCSVMLSGFKVLAFGIKHDASDPVGFLIFHPECGNVLFLTDTWFSPFKFRNLNQLIIEANYAEDILEENVLNGAIHPSVVNRVKESHMSLEILKDLLLANDLSQVNNICLIHLSSANSDAKRFQKEITLLTGKTVTIAEKGLSIDFNVTPF